MKNLKETINPTPYNPLDKKNLGVSVADALLASPAQIFPLQEAFQGAGIYAIYYVGDFPIYTPLAMENRNGKLQAPIYVGKAIPEGARKGGVGLGIAPGTVLYKRLDEHAKSIENANNLKLEDFFCRYLVVDDIWIPLGESLLIAMFSPVWNRVLDGFGNHDPGSGRHKQQRSPWDVLHPGRTWADRLQPNVKSLEQIEKSVRLFLEKNYSQEQA